MLETDTFDVGDQFDEITYGLVLISMEGIVPFQD